MKYLLPILASLLLLAGCGSGRFKEVKVLRKSDYWLSGTQYTKLKVQDSQGQVFVVDNYMSGGNDNYILAEPGDVITVELPADVK